MSDFRVSLLGRPALEGPAGPVAISSLKARALLWHLAARPDSLFSRADLASLLWGDGEDGDSRGSLNKALSHLRQTLPVWPLRAAGGALGWDATAGVTVDTARFRELTRSQDPGQLAAAVQLWRGPFLEGFHVPGSAAYDLWLQGERRHWEQDLLATLAGLAGAAEAAAAWAVLLDHGRRALAIDPFQERFHRWVMLALDQMENRAAALAQYKACCLLLRDELGVSPDPATTALRDAIAGGHLPRRAAPTGGRSRAPGWRGAGPAAPAPSTDLPLCGREAELTGITAALARAAAGERRVVLLYGEAGIGKTRLVREVLSRAWQSPDEYQTVAPGHCYEETRDLPYAPFIAALNGLLPALDLGRLDLPAVWLAEVSRLLPDLPALRPDLPGPAALDPDQEPYRLWEGVTRFLAALPRPVLLVMEDIHLADPASLRLLSYLARQPVFPGLAILATARAGDVPEGTERLLRQLQREDRLAWLDVGLLSAAGTGSLAAAFIGRPDGALGARLHAKTGGNPLFAVECLRSLQQGAQAQGPDPAALDLLAVPASVQAVVRGRMARLVPAAQALLAAAAIFPRPVPFAIVQQVAGLTRETAVAALETLLRSELLRETGQAGAPAVAFGHDLVRQAVSEGISRPSRQSLHRGAYQALAADAGTDRAGLAAPPAAGRGPGSLSWLLAEELAHHAMAGGLWQQGLAWSLQAAEAARRLPSARARFLEQALDCLQQLPATPDRRRQALYIRLKLSVAFMYSQPERIPELFMPAEADAMELGEQMQLARVRIFQAIINTYQGRLHDSLAVLEQAIATVRVRDDGDLLGDGLRSLGIALAVRGEFDRAIEAFAEAAPLANHGIISAFVPAALILAHGAKGDFARSESVCRSLLEQGDGPTHGGRYCLNLGFTTLHSALRGDWQAISALSPTLIRLARETAYPFQEYMAHLFYGPTLVWAGDVAGALQAQQETLALARRSATQLWLGLAYAWLGQIHLAAGNLAAAAEAARTGLELARTQDNLYDGALCTKVLGKVAAAAGQAAPARQLLLGALQQFTALSARPEMARCHTALAAAGAQPDRPQHRAQAEQMFAAMGMARDLEML